MTSIAGEGLQDYTIATLLGGGFQEMWELAYFIVPKMGYNYKGIHFMDPHQSHLRTLPMQHSKLFCGFASHVFSAEPLKPYRDVGLGKGGTYPHQ